MTKLIRAAALAAFALAPIACNTSSQGGSPAAGAKKTFTVSGPTMATTIKQGDKQTVDLTLDRGSDFKQTVKLDATAPSGIKATLSDTSVEASEPAKVTLTIEVDKSAALGDHMIKIKATPESGNATEIDVKVKVEEKK